MNTLFRWLIRIFAGMLLLGGLFVLGIYYFGTRSIPDYNTTYSIDGINGPVEIVRDTSNVPHIFGDTDNDVYFGLGFAHAQDRLWQMTMMRRAVQGRLSELFGSATVKTDELFRRYDLYGAAVASVAAQDPETRAALEAYARGVNAWIAQVNKGALGRGAPEFFMFSNQISYWQPADSIAMGKLMAIQLSGALEQEVRRARVSLVLPDNRVRDILPDVPGAGIAALPEFAQIVPGVTPSLAPIDYAHGPFLPSGGPELAGASNAWSAAPTRAAARGTLLANDPHLGFTAPGIWYLARLELASGGVIGGSVPGAPTILLGRSDKLAWGLTSAYLDDLDVHIEKLNPDNPEEYLTPQGYRAFKTRRTIINVKDEAPITITLRWTENGPVLPGTHYDLASVTPKGHVASIAWTALSGQDTSISGALRIMQSHSVDQALDAAALWYAPAQNLSLIDDSNIAMQMVGAMPRRDARHQSQGRMPSPGWAEENLWLGTFPYSANPRFVNPPGGVLGNTNNKLVDRPFPLHVSFVWGDTQRIERWRKLMQDRQVHTRESFIEAQLDTVSYSARALLPLVARDMWYAPEAAAEGTLDRQRQKALALLADWNGEMNEHIPEPLIYSAWMRRLQQRLIRDDLGPLAEAFTHVEPLFIERVFRNIDGASAWCDVVQSTAVETCDQIAQAALDEALLWIDETHGGALESLRWGGAHQAHHDHPVLGDIPLLKWVVNIRQSTSGGDQTLNRGKTSGDDPDPFANVHGAGYRGVYDFADPDSSVFITATGQSGHPFSRHYDDLGELWRRGEYIPMSLDADLARAGAVGITVLTPAP